MTRLFAVAAVLSLVAACGAERPDRLVIAYGDEPAQFGELTVPEGEGPHPVVVLIHGGFWLNTFGLDLMHDIERDLVERGYAVWNIEFRRVGDPGGGWPGTLEDVGSALDHLSELGGAYELDLEAVHVVGHSSGGHLALWAGGRSTLLSELFASPEVAPSRVVALAPVADLELAAQLGLGRGAVSGLLHGLPDARPDRYRSAGALPPSDIVTVVVVAEDDRIVPFAVSVPDALEDMVAVAPGDHFSLIDPASDAWDVVLTAIEG